MRTSTVRRLALLAAGMILACTLAACSDDSGDSAKSTTTTTAAATTTTEAATTTTVASTTTTASQAGPVAGTYLNAGTNDPHYSLVLQTSNGTGIGGSLSYVAQDGNTNQLFTFSGTAGGGSGSATPTTGSAFTFTYTANQVVLANCSAFMQEAPTTCTFNLQ